MSHDQMDGPGWELPDALVQHMEDVEAQHAAVDREREQLAERARDIPGPLGDLLRTIAAKHEDWLDAACVGAVTEAESGRMEQIVDAAVALEQWLRGAS